MAAVTGAVAATPSRAAGSWEQQGRAFFLSCEFKQAGRAFEKALAEQPGRADLYYWLGRSYARQADVSGPMMAARWARKAGRNLEMAVRLEPANEAYFRELFEFYLDSPEWFGGGLRRAEALVEDPHIPASVSATALQHIAAARDEYRGAGWLTHLAILRTSGAVGTLVPAR